MEDVSVLCNIGAMYADRSDRYIFIADLLMKESNKYLLIAQDFETKSKILPTDLFGDLILKKQREYLAKYNYSIALEYKLNANYNLIIASNCNLDAESKLLHALDIDSTNYIIHYNLALVYLTVGNKVKARRYLQNTVRLNPTHTEAQEKLATLNEEAQDKEVQDKEAQYKEVQDKEAQVELVA